MAKRVESKILLLLLILFDNKEGKLNEILKEGQKSYYLEKSRKLQMVLTSQSCLSCS